ncbi:MAG: (d)CMP kinase [Defluviitaleaceae bacterium]|nr:(d)CMP kinase [Defluviitaleaceae bacterium]
MRIRIAIDGPSGSGKSTIAKAVAARLGFVHIDTGAMFRAVALCAYRSGKKWDNESEVLSILGGINIDIAYVQGGQRVYVSGEDVTDAVRTAEMGVGAAAVATYEGVREKLLQIQQRLVKSRNVVMDGRDIGTVVLPDAPVKIFLTASLEARVQRRLNELSAMGLTHDVDSITQQMQKRDYDDTNRASAPLKCAPDSVMVDTSDMDIEQVIETILQIIKEKGVLDV